MRIEIDPAAARSPDAHYWLDRLLHRIEDRWHVWEVDGLEDFESSSWVAERGTKGAETMELFRYSVNRSAWAKGPHTRWIRVTIEPSTDGELTPEQGARFADEQMIILVENRESDGDFLKRLVAEMDPTLNRWMQLYPSPIRIDSLGGRGQMRDEVSKRQDVYPRARLLAVVDSDRTVPSDSPSIEAQRLDRECRELEFSCWVLAKRESENYLPRELMELRSNAGNDHLSRMDAWDRMSDEQKDYYDMKSGLTNEPSEAEEDLYGTLPDSDRDILTQGFGEHIGVCWKVYRGNRGLDWDVRCRSDLKRGLALIRQEV